MVPERLFRVAYDQDGLITRTQAITLGVSDDAIRHALGPEGRWQRIHRGIYATFNGPLSEVHRLRAALLHGGFGAMITGATACRLADLKYGPDPGDVIDVLVPHRCQRSGLDLVHVHRSRRLPRPWYWIAAGDIDTVLHAHEEDADELVDGALRWQLPVAALPRAAMDAARFLQLALVAGHNDRPPRWLKGRLLQDTRALLCEVVQRRRATTDDLIAELRAAPTAGTAIARRAMDDILAGCRSAPECELRDLIQKSKMLPEPRWNRSLPGITRSSGQAGIYPDACWPEAHLVVEVNSVEWHRIGPAQEKTEKRHTLYAELGWRVIPISPHRIRTEPEIVLQQIEHAYRAPRA